MNIFSFGVHFTDEESCRLHFKSERDKIGVVCIVAKAISTIGYKTNGVMSVNHVDQDSLCEAEQLWKVLNYPL